MLYEDRVGLEVLVPVLLGRRGVANTCGAVPVQVEKEEKAKEEAAAQDQWSTPAVGVPDAETTMPSGGEVSCMTQGELLSTPP